MTTANLDLKSYCCKIRKDIIEPFNCQGEKIATDGRILVAVPTSEPDHENSMAAKVANLLNKSFGSATSWQPWPAHDGATDEIKCRECGGCGKEIIKCEECGGDGETYCNECDNANTCKECCGKGEVESGEPCEKCRGNKKISVPASQKLPTGQTIAGGYFKLVEDIGGVEFGEVAGEIEPVPFRFQGGRGLVMPTRILS